MSPGRRRPASARGASEAQPRYTYDPRGLPPKSPSRPQRPASAGGWGTRSPMRIDACTTGTMRDVGDTAKPVEREVRAAASVPRFARRSEESAQSLAESEDGEWLASARSRVASLSHVGSPDDTRGSPEGGNREIRMREEDVDHRERDHTSFVGSPSHR